MHLLCAVVEEHLYVVAKLRSAHYRVVAEHYAVAFQQRFLRYELHLSHEVASALAARSKAAGPCGSIFQYGAAIRYVVPLCVADSHAHARVGNAADKVGFGIVFHAHLPAVFLAHVFSVDAFVVACRKTVVHPQERAYLHLVRRFLQYLHAVGAQAYDFARTDVAHHLVVEVGEARRLARGCIGTILASDDDRRAPHVVACGYDAVFSQYEHRARAVNLLVDEVDAFYEGLAHVDEQSHEFRLIDVVGRHLAEVHVLSQQFGGNLADVVYLCNGNDGIAPQVRVDDDRLRVGVADDAQTLIAEEAVELVLELAAEVVAFQTVNGTAEAALAVESYHTCTLGA